MATTLETMQAHRFGIEIETVTLAREAAAKAIQTVVGGTVSHAGGGYDVWQVTAVDGRVWKAMRDGSLTNSDTAAEVVSPILTWTDLDALQNVVRALRAAGAKIDSSCGIHVHIDAAPFDAAGLVRLVKLANKWEPLLMHALKIHSVRSDNFCKPVHAAFLEAGKGQRVTSKDQLRALWYGQIIDANRSPADHYHRSRYHGVNLHAVWYRGTVEFRYFNGSLHAGEIKTYVQLCLALGAKALTSKRISDEQPTVNPAATRYAMRKMIHALDLGGETFKTARHHLDKHLTGWAAFADGAPSAEWLARNRSSGTTPAAVESTGA